MKRMKYLVVTEKGKFESNSRNARKHLFEKNVDSVCVYTNDDWSSLVCMAIKTYGESVILSGAVRKEK